MQNKAWATYELEQLIKKHSSGGGIAVEITDVPPTATQGTFSEAQLIILQANDNNFIEFNNEKYYLMDKGHTEGFVTYSHVGIENSTTTIKMITITWSTGSWVLTTKAVGGGTKLYKHTLGDVVVIARFSEVIIFNETIQSWELPIQYKNYDILAVYVYYGNQYKYLASGMILDCDIDDDNHDPMWSYIEAIKYYDSKTGDIKTKYPANVPDVVTEY